MSAAWWIALVVVAFVVASVGSAITVAWVRLRRGGRRRIQLERARQHFHLRREWLEVQFLSLASQTGKPRGLAWENCDFQDDVAFARDRETGELRALVGVTISFTAIAGGDLEDNPNVGNLRAATAVFRFDRDQWTTDGRAIFNLNPVEAIRHFQNELERVE